MTDDPSHDDLVDQAEAVLGATEATMYDVASGEAYRLQELLDEKRDLPDSVGTVEGFVEDLSSLTQKHGIFLESRTEQTGTRQLNLVRLNSTHERPSEYPDLAHIDGFITYSTLGEFYGYIDWFADDGGDD